MFTELELEILQDALEVYMEAELADAYLSEIQAVEDLIDKVGHLLEYGE